MPLARKRSERSTSSSEASDRFVEAMELVKGPGYVPQSLKHPEDTRRVCVDICGPLGGVGQHAGPPPPRTVRVVTVLGSTVREHVRDDASSISTRPSPLLGGAQRDRCG